MQFVATHDVTADDVASVARLSARWTDGILSIIVVVVLLGILVQVLYAFSIYIRASTGHPGKLVDLLLFGDGPVSAVVSWLSILVTLCLPIFLFYTVRSLAEMIWPAWRARRVMKNSDMAGLATYTIDDRGVRAVKEGGSEVFFPWTAFDGIRDNGELAVLLRKAKPLFFVPITAFGAEQQAVLAALRNRIERSGAN